MKLKLGLFSPFFIDFILLNNLLAPYGLFVFLALYGLYLFNPLPIYYPAGI